jgi:sterol 24-C-methyltransferase
MSPIALEKEDHQRDAAFKQVLHGNTTQAEGGIRSMLGKNKEAQKAAVAEYFKHFDDKTAADETEESRKARRDEYATLTRQYVQCAKRSNCSLT